MTAASPSRISPASKAAGLAIAGVQPLSTVDWPGKLAAVLFLQGCPWSCPYCHNFGILDPKAPGQVAWEQVLGLLKRRQGLLDGVVFSGGEATRQPALVDAARQVKSMGFQVGLHTAGAYPATFRRLLDERLFDWVGMDIKALPADYAEVAGPSVSATKAEESLRVLVESGIDYEIRFTLWKGGLDYARQVADWCFERGARSFVLQKLQTQSLPPGFVPGAEVTAWSSEAAEEMLSNVGFDKHLVRV